MQLVIRTYTVTMFAGDEPHPEAPVFAALWQAKLFCTLHATTAVYIFDASFIAPFSFRGLGSWLLLRYKLFVSGFLWIVNGGEIK